MPNEATFSSAALAVYRLGLEKAFGSAIFTNWPNLAIADTIKDWLDELGLVDDWNETQLYTPVSLLARYTSDNWPSGGRLRYFVPNQETLKLPSILQPALLSQDGIKKLTEQVLQELQECQTTALSLPVLRHLAKKYLSQLGIRLSIGINQTECYPLYDILHTLAALSVAKRQNSHYVLAALDISGIQDFVYNIRSTKALQSLRGRSLWLQLVAQTVLNELLNVLNLTVDCLLTDSGGYYVLLLPKLNPDELKVLDSIVQRWNEYWLNLQEGRVFLAWAVADDVPLQSEDLLGRSNDTYNRANASLGRKLSEVKQRKFAQQLTLDKLQPQKPQTACWICRRDVKAEQLYQLTSPDEPEDARQKVCDLCWFVIQLGRQIDLGQRDFTINQFVSNGTLTWQLNQIVPSAKVELGVISENAILRPINLKLNPARAIEVVHHPLVVYAPFVELPPKLKSRVQEELEKEETVEDSVSNPTSLLTTDLSLLAKMGPGWEGIAALRADVDNLGVLLREGGEHAPLVTLIGTSRLLTDFLANYIKELPRPGVARNWLSSLDQPLEQARPLIIIYGGGDDLFCLGAWYAILEFALDLQNLWQQYVGYNPAVTLSAGLSLHKPKFPVQAMADLSGELLENAKDNVEQNQNGKHEKDSLAVSFARRPLFWEQVLSKQSPLIRLIQPLYRMLTEDGSKTPRLSRSFLRRLIEADSNTWVADPANPGQYKHDPRGQVDLLYLLTTTQTEQLKIDEDWKLVRDYLKEVHRSVPPPDLSFYLEWLDLRLRETDSSNRKEITDDTAL